MDYGKINDGTTHVKDPYMVNTRMVSPTIPHVVFDLNLRANQQLTWLDSSPIPQKFKTTRL